MTYDQNRVQRNWGPRVRDFTYHGLRLVTLENELLRVGVLAGKGADIVEFNYKPRDLDFVWLNGRGVRNPNNFVSTSPDLNATFLEVYPGGWQEIFPNGGGSSDYRGAQFGQHGEVSNLPWDVRIDEESEQAVQVAFTVRALKTPFVLERTLRLEANDPTLYVTSRVENESEVPLRAMWGEHLAFGRPFLDQSCRITLPDGLMIHPNEEGDIDGRRLSPQVSAWPYAVGASGERIDLSRLPEPGEPSDWAYLSGFTEGWYEIAHPGKQIGMRVEWDAETMPYLWYWQEFNGLAGYPWWGRNYVVGLEPFSSVPTSGLQKAIENDSALSFGPRDAKTFWMRTRVIGGEA